MAQIRVFTWRSALASADSGLSPTQRHVALTLSLHMSERGDQAFPSVPTLAAETGLGQRTVQGSLRELEAKGWLRNERKGGGRGRTSMWTAVVPVRETVQQEHPSTNPAAETVHLTTTNPADDDEKPRNSCGGGRKENSSGGRNPVAQRRDELWDALTEVFGEPATATERSLRGKVRRELAEAGATPADVLAVVAEHRRRWPTVDCTPPSLIKNWTTLSRAGPSSPSSRVRRGFEQWAQMGGENGSESGGDAGGTAGRSVRSRALP